MKSNQRITIIITSIVLVSGLFCLLFFSGIMSDRSIATSRNAVLSHDGNYTLTRMDGRHTKNYLGAVSSFLVLKTADNGYTDVCFDSMRVWSTPRVMILTWGKGTNDIWLYSSDEGFFYYKFMNSCRWNLYRISFGKTDGHLTVSYYDINEQQFEIRESELPKCIIEKMEQIGTR